MPIGNIATCDPCGSTRLLLDRVDRKLSGHEADGALNNLFLLIENFRSHRFATHYDRRTDRLRAAMDGAFVAAFEGIPVGEAADRLAETMRSIERGDVPAAAGLQRLQAFTRELRSGLG